MDDAPTYASLTEEINSLKRLQKVHKARFDVAQKARRTKLDGPGEAVRQAQASRSSSRQGAKPARPPRPVRTHDARALSGEFPAKLLRMAYVPDENQTLHLHATHNTRWRTGVRRGALEGDGSTSSTGHERARRGSLPQGFE